MRLLLMAIMLTAATAGWSQEKKVEFKPEIHGTVRAKYECQTEEGESWRTCRWRWIFR